MWSDTVWLAPLFLASAASTSLALMSLIARHWEIGTAAARERLEGAEPLALGLELVILGGFVASLGNNLGPVLMTVRGSLLIFGTLLLAVLLPLLLHGRIGHRRSVGHPGRGALRLLGGLLLRYGAVTTPGELLRARSRKRVADAFAPEGNRHARSEPAWRGHRRNHGAEPVVPPLQAEGGGSHESDALPRPPPQRAEGER